MRTCYVLALAVLLGLSACGNGGGDKDGGTTSYPDFAGLDLTGLDLTNTMPMNSGKLDAYWQLLNKNLQGTAGNFFTTTCMEATATKITFKAKNTMSGAVAMTTIECPAMMTNGPATILLPDTTEGPFAVCATLPGLMASNSEAVMNVAPKNTITVRIFAEGCDYPNCICP